MERNTVYLRQTLTDSMDVCSHLPTIVAEVRGRWRVRDTEHQMQLPQAKSQFFLHAVYLPHVIYCCERPQSPVRHILFHLHLPEGLPAQLVLTFSSAQTYPRFSSCASDMIATRHMQLFKFKWIKISSVQSPHMARGYHIGQQTIEQFHLHRKKSFRASLK